MNYTSKGWYFYFLHEVQSSEQLRKDIRMWSTIYFPSFVLYGPCLRNRNVIKDYNLSLHLIYSHLYAFPIFCQRSKVGSAFVLRKLCHVADVSQWDVYKSNCDWPKSWMMVLPSRCPRLTGETLISMLLYRFCLQKN